jgi:hypothetical protein
VHFERKGVRPAIYKSRHPGPAAVIRCARLKSQLACERLTRSLLRTIEAQRGTPLGPIFAG